MAAWDRVIGVMAGLLGAAGVAASAGGAHAMQGGNLDTAGKMLLIHAAALLALSIPSRFSNRLRRASALVMTVGVCLFAGDLTLRALEGLPLFPMAAPLGGLLMIASWLIAALAAVAGTRD